MKNWKIRTGISAGFDALQVSGAIRHFNQVIQQNSAASGELASTAGGLSSQAEIRQSSIAFFKSGETYHSGTPQQRRQALAGPARHQAVHARTGEPRPPAGGLPRMQQAVNLGGAAIDLDSNNGGAGPHNRNFAPYGA